MQSLVTVLSLVGEAFEGFDEASELGTGIIIVVNDNEMSIAEPHGGIYKTYVTYVKAMASAITTGLRLGALNIST